MTFKPKIYTYYLEPHITQENGVFHYHLYLTNHKMKKPVFIYKLKEIETCDLLKHQAALKEKLKLYFKGYKPQYIKIMSKNC